MASRRRAERPDRSSAAATVLCLHPGVNRLRMQCSSGAAAPFIGVELANCRSMSTIAARHAVPTGAWCSTRHGFAPRMLADAAALCGYDCPGRRSKRSAGTNGARVDGHGQGAGLTPNR